MTVEEVEDILRQCKIRASNAQYFSSQLKALDAIEKFNVTAHLDYKSLYFTIDSETIKQQLRADLESQMAENDVHLKSLEARVSNWQ